MESAATSPRRGCVAGTPLTRFMAMNEKPFDWVKHYERSKKILHRSILFSVGSLVVVAASVALLAWNFRIEHRVRAEIQQAREMHCQ